MGHLYICHYDLSFNLYIINKTYMCPIRSVYYFVLFVQEQKAH